MLQPVVCYFKYRKRPMLQEVLSVGMRTKDFAAQVAKRLSLRPDKDVIVVCDASTHEPLRGSQHWVMPGSQVELLLLPPHRADAVLAEARSRCGAGASCDSVVESQVAAASASAAFALALPAPAPLQVPDLSASTADVAESSGASPACTTGTGDLSPSVSETFTAPPARVVRVVADAVWFGRRGGGFVCMWTDDFDPGQHLRETSFHWQPSANEHDATAAVVAYAVSVRTGHPDVTRLMLLSPMFNGGHRALSSTHLATLQAAYDVVAVDWASCTDEGVRELRKSGMRAFRAFTAQSAATS